MQLITLQCRATSARLREGTDYNSHSVRSNLTGIAPSGGGGYFISSLSSGPIQDRSERSPLDHSENDASTGPSSWRDTELSKKDSEFMSGHTSV